MTKAKVENFKNEESKEKREKSVWVGHGALKRGNRDD